MDKTDVDNVFENTVLEGKEVKYSVIKLNDLVKYNKSSDIAIFLDLTYKLFKNVETGRKKDSKKPNNSYIVINTDEPYINEIVDILKNNDHWDL